MAIRRRQHALVDESIRRNAGRWETLDAAGRAAVEAMLHTLVDRLMASPAAVIAGLEDERRAAEALRVIDELFGVRHDEHAPRALVGA